MRAGSAWPRKEAGKGSSEGRKIHEEFPAKKPLNKLVRGSVHVTPVQLCLGGGGAIVRESSPSLRFGGERVGKKVQSGSAWSKIICGLYFLSRKLKEKKNRKK